MIHGAFGIIINVLIWQLNCWKINQLSNFIVVHIKEWINTWNNLCRICRSYKIFSIFSRVSQCKPGPTLEGSSCKLRPHGPNSRPTLDTTEHRSLRWRSEQRHINWTWIGSSVYQFSYDFSNSNAWSLPQNIIIIWFCVIFLGFGK